MFILPVSISPYYLREYLSVDREKSKIVLLGVQSHRVVVSVRGMELPVYDVENFVDARRESAENGIFFRESVREKSAPSFTRTL